MDRCTYCCNHLGCFWGRPGGCCRPEHSKIIRSCTNFRLFWNPRLQKLALNYKVPDWKEILRTSTGPHFFDYNFHYQLQRSIKEYSARVHLVHTNSQLAKALKNPDLQQPVKFNQTSQIQQEPVKLLDSSENCYRNPDTNSHIDDPVEVTPQQQQSLATENICNHDLIDFNGSIGDDINYNDGTYYITQSFINSISQISPERFMHDYLERTKTRNEWLEEYSDE